MNKKMLDALASAIYVSKLSLAGETVTKDDQKIRAAGLYPDWEAGNHAKGEIYNTHAGDSLARVGADLGVLSGLRQCLLSKPYSRRPLLVHLQSASAW